MALTAEQQAAYQAYRQAVAQAELELYGGPPCGAILREETEAEQAAWEAYQDTLKTPEQRLRERMEAAALAYWQTFIDQAQHVHIIYSGEEESNVARCYWIDAGDIGPGDRLFEVQLHVGWPDCYYTVEIWLAMQEGESINLLQVRCTGVLVSDLYYKPHRIPQEARQALREMGEVW